MLVAAGLGSTVPVVAAAGPVLTAGFDAVHVGEVFTIPISIANDAFRTSGASVGLLSNLTKGGSGLG
jgi:hypothetical protein